jgi:hypothetical protein
VRHATVLLTGDRDYPEVELRLAVTPDADMGDLGHHVDRAMVRFRRTSGLRPEVADVIVQIADRARQRVR